MTAVDGSAIVLVIPVMIWFGWCWCWYRCHRNHHCCHTHSAADNHYYMALALTGSLFPILYHPPTLLGPDPTKADHTSDILEGDHQVRRQNYVETDILDLPVAVVVQTHS